MEEKPKEMPVDLSDHLVEMTNANNKLDEAVAKHLGTTDPDTIESYKTMVYAEGKSNFIDSVGHLCRFEKVDEINYEDPEMQKYLLKGKSIYRCAEDCEIKVWLSDYEFTNLSKVLDKMRNC